MLDPIIIALILAIAAWDAGGAFEVDRADPTTIAMCLALPLGVAIAGVLRLRWLLRRLDRTSRLACVLKADRTLALSRALVAGAFAVTVLQYGWLGMVRAAIGDLVLADEALALAPALLALLLLWWGYAPIDERIHEAVLMRRLDLGQPIARHASRSGYVLDRVRHQALLTLAPIGLISAWSEASNFLLPRLLDGLDTTVADAATVAIYAIGVGAVLLMMPPIVRCIWDTAALEGGPTRERLDELCRRHRVRCREILVWRTRSGMLNAAVMGLIGRFRYILLTDALLEQLTPDQIEAVMAHEVGHVRRAHLPWLMLALAGAVGMGFLAGDAAAAALQQRISTPDWIAETVALFVVFVVGFFSFGVVSRRFERQADAFAVQHLSGLSRDDAASRRLPITDDAALVMSSALARVSRLNHAPAERFTWRHGSIRGRMRAIADLVGRPINALAIDRQARAIHVAAILTAALVALLTILRDGTPDDQPAEANSPPTFFQLTTLHQAEM